MKKRDIQVFKAVYDVDACLNQIRQCLEIGWTGMGFKTVEFENMWKNYTGCKNAFFTNSSTAGLYLACDILKETLGWDNTSEIITTPITFVSTNHAILKAGLKPVFADVDDTLCLDPNSILENISVNTKAVMYVGIGGNTGHLDEVIKICKEKGLILLLDAAHMAGTRYKGEIVGPHADVTIYSFQAVKNLPTGDSGMICFKDEKLDAIARKKAWLGINKDTYSRSNSGAYKWKYDVEYVGDKYHGNSVMAAIAIAQLAHLDDDNQYRRKLAKQYDEILGELSDKIGFIYFPQECIPSRHLYQITVEDREGLISYLNGNGISPGVHYVDNTEYRMYKDFYGRCPNAQYYSNHVLTLPSHLGILDEDVEYICQSIKEFMQD